MSSRDPDFDPTEQRLHGRRAATLYQNDWQTADYVIVTPKELEELLERERDAFVGRTKLRDEFRRGQAEGYKRGWARGHAVGLAQNIGDEYDEYEDD